MFRSNAAGGLDALRDGKIDVFINGGFLPTAEIADVARGRPLAWIAGDPAKNKAAADRWTNVPIAVPKGIYPFVTQDDVSIALWNSVVVGAHVSEETVYKFVKALAQHQDRMRSIHPVARRSSRSTRCPAIRPSCPTIRAPRATTARSGC